MERTCTYVVGGIGFIRIMILDQALHVAFSCKLGWLDKGWVWNGIISSRNDLKGQLIHSCGA